MKQKLLLWTSMFSLLWSMGKAQIISTIAGTGHPGYSGDGGPAISAQFNFPYGIIIDKSGALYIADHENNVIRKITSSGIVSTVAGNNTAGYSGDGGPALNAELNGPNSIALDNAGNLYICDTHNSVIRKVNTAGIISTYAGSGISGYSGDGGPATSAQITPYSIALNGTGDLFICDIFNSVIRKVNSAGIISTFAGTGAVGYSGDGGPAVKAKFNFLYGVAVDVPGNVYVVDYGNNVIRRIDCNGIINTIAGNGIRGYDGDGGPAISAQLSPLGIAIDKVGNIYVSDYSHDVIRKINTVGVITTIAGNGTFGYSGDGGPAVSAQLASLYGIAIDDAGNLFICDNYFSVIRKVTGNLPQTATLYPTPADTTVCTGGSAFFSISPMPGYQYQWQVNDGTGWTSLTNGGVYSGTGTEQLSIQHATTTINGSQYRCNVFSTCGYLSISTSVVLNVSSSFTTPSLNIVSSSDIFCQDDSISFRAMPTNGGNKPSYLWQLNGINVGKDTPVYTVKNPVVGDVVKCIMTSNADCAFPASVNSNSITLQLDPNAAAVNIEGPSSMICSGEAVSFRANPLHGGPDPSYQWQVNGINAGTDSNVFTTSSLHDGDAITCKMIAGNACPAPVSSNKISVVVFPSPVISVSHDTIVAGGNSFQLHPAVSGDISAYTWTPASELSDPFIADPVMDPVNSITYQLRVVANNGCDASATIKVGVFYGLQIPNAFTPNGDGHNEVFRIPPSVPVRIKSFSVFNRWGDKVFTTSDSGQGWDGTYQNQPQPVGSYIWEIIYEDVFTKKIITQSGSVVLVR